MPRNDPNYMREYQRKRRAKTKTGATQTNDGSEPSVDAKTRNKLQGTPFRDEAGRMVLDRGTGKDLGGEHYWGHISHAEEGTRVCDAFEFQGRWIGGCGMVVTWEGHPLPTNVDGEPDLATAIIDSEHYKEIQQKMPVTKARER